MMRAMRPDRMTYAVEGFIEEKLGHKFIENRSVEFSKSFEESGKFNILKFEASNEVWFILIIGSETPIFFILSPGVNPLKDVEALGKVLGYTQTNKNFHIVSLGQGQEVVAEAAMQRGADEGLKDYLITKLNILTPSMIMSFIPRSLGHAAEHSLGENMVACFRKTNWGTL